MYIIKTISTPNLGIVFIKTIITVSILCIIPLLFITAFYYFKYIKLLSESKYYFNAYIKEKHFTFGQPICKYMKNITFQEFKNDIKDINISCIKSPKISFSFYNIGCGYLITNDFICINNILYMPNTFRDYLQIINYLKNEKIKCIKYHQLNRILKKMEYFPNNGNMLSIIANNELNHIYIFNDSSIFSNGDKTKPAVYFDIDNKSIYLFGITLQPGDLSFITAAYTVAYKNKDYNVDTIADSVQEYLSDKFIEISNSDEDISSFICIVSVFLETIDYESLKKIIFIKATDVKNYSNDTFNIINNKSLRKYTAIDILSQK